MPSLDREAAIELCVELGFLIIPFASTYFGTTLWVADTGGPDGVMELEAPAITARITDTRICFYTIGDDEAAFLEHVSLLRQVDARLRAGIASRKLQIPSEYCGGPVLDRDHPAWLGVRGSPVPSTFEGHPALAGRSLVRLIGLLAWIAAPILRWDHLRHESMEHELVMYRYDFATYGLLWLAIEPAGARPLLP